MQPQELIAHRTEICSDVEMILDGYWKDRPSEEMKARILSDWADTLQDFHHNSVLAALRKWRNENPNRKPNPGHILSILKEGWGKKVVREAQPAPEPDIQEITPEEKKKRQELADELLRSFKGNVSQPDGE